MNLVKSARQTANTWNGLKKRNIKKKEKYLG